MFKKMMREGKKGMTQKINHIGIAVEDIDAMLSMLKDAFGAREIGRKEFPEESQISSLVQLGDGYIELMQPTSSKGAIGKFLDQRGEGLHHVSILCEDFRDTVRKMEGMGMVLIRGLAQADWNVAFVHPRSLHGVLVELTDQDSSKDGR
jgi:methylmalonyl-CoA epimerase